MPFKKADPNQQRYSRKVRLAGDEETLGRLDGQSKICCWLQNRLKQEIDQDMALLRHGYFWGVLDEERADTILSSVYNEIGVRNRIPALKQQHPFLNLVHSSPLKNIGLRTARTITAHRKAKAKGQPYGWLRYHAWSRAWTSLEYDEPGKGWKIQGDRLRLSFGSKDGQRLSAELTLLDPPQELKRAKTCRILREERNRYYAVFTFSVAKPRTKPTALPKVAYLDPNLKNFAYVLDMSGRAVEIANLAVNRSREQQHDRLTSKRDRCLRRSIWIDTCRADGTVSTYDRPSRRWVGYDRALQRHDEKTREQRKHFLFSLAHALVAEYDLIGIGDDVPANADHGRGRRYNRAVRNRPLHGRFKTILAWVAQRSGKRVVVLNETGTTRTCHGCGHVMKGGLDPSIREWDCPRCQRHHHRDENACQNGLRRLLAAGNLDMPCSGPVAVRRRCDWHFHPQGWQEVSKEGANENQTQPPVFRRVARQHVCEG